MKSTAPIVLTLGIEPGSDPIEGRITDAAGRAHEFAGWMGLASAIDAVLSTATNPPQEERK